MSLRSGLKKKTTKNNEAKTIIFLLISSCNIAHLASTRPIKFSEATTADIIADIIDDTSALFNGLLVIYEAYR